MKNFLSNAFLYLLQRIPYVQKLELDLQKALAARDKAIAEKADLEYFISQSINA